MITVAIASILTLIATLILFNNSMTSTASSWWVKLLMPLSVVTAYVTNITHWDLFSIMFMVGMCFVVLGDAIFAFDKDNKNFIYGLGAFAVAYFIIIGAFVFGMGAITKLLWFVAPAVYFLTAAMYRKGFVFSPKSSYRVPVAVYTVIVSSLVVAATVTGSVLAVTGAFLALYCDMSIGLDCFGNKKLVYRDNFVFVPYNIGHLVLMLALLPLL